MNRQWLQRVVLSAAVAGLFACSSVPKNEPPYQYTPAWPNDVKAPAAGSEGDHGAPMDAAMQWASYTEKTGEITQRPHISGTCLLSDGVSELPCVGVIFVLYEVDPSNGHKAEVDRQNTHRSGKFLFVVDSRKKYVLEPLSDSYSENVEGPSPAQAGDQLTIHLKTR